MKDSEFRRLPHRLGRYRISSLGSAVATSYKPDMTMNDENDHLGFIFECEQKTDRKAFLGNVIKAEKYAEEAGARPVLVIVMQEKANTTINQIANHLRPYAAWLRSRNGGALSLSGIWLITDNDYLQSVLENELIASPQFRERIHVIY